MKMLSPQTVAGTRAGFTLIELLVVISIIAVLAMLSMAAVQTVLVNAQKASARNDCGQIVIAVKSYYNDYGKYPVSDSSTKVFGTPNGKKTGTNYDLIRPLRYGADDAQPDQNNLNPRQIHYLDVSPAKDKNNPKSGIDTAGNWMDPWGFAYVVFIDADYTNQIDVSKVFTTGLGSAASPGMVSIGAGAASVGYDITVKLRSMPTSFNQAADVVSWR